MALEYSGKLLSIDKEFSDDTQVFDILTGQTLSIETSGGTTIISGTIPEEGILGIYITPASAITVELNEFMSTQKKSFENADFSFEPWEGDHRKTELTHKVVHSPEPIPHENAPTENMVPVPGFKGTLKQRYRMRECGFIDDGRPSALHVYDAFEEECFDASEVEFGDLWVDTYPVTNQQFYEFVQTTNYKPQNGQRFLDHWVDGCPPKGLENHPVVYTSLNDARAYAKWAGKRLPNEAEWQKSCLGDLPYLYPWGSEMNIQIGNPNKRKLCNDGRQGGTTPVDKYTEGASPYGCMDMIGNTWEWTESERTDGHTRYAILKGGCWYGAEGSFWLFDGGPRAGDWAAKMMLMHDGWDRCATVGFRCVADRTDGKAVTLKKSKQTDTSSMLGQG